MVGDREELEDWIVVCSDDIGEYGSAFCWHGWLSEM